MSYQYRMSHVHQLQDGTWRYWRRVPPKDIAPLIGKTCWAKRLGRLSRADAEAAARIEDVRHDATIARLRRLSNAEREAIATAGGIGRMKRRLAGSVLNLDMVNTADAVMADLDTRYAADPEYQAYLDTDVVVRSELARLKETPVVKAKLAAEIETGQRAVAAWDGTAAPVAIASRNILDLVPLWQKIKGSQKKSSLRHMKHYAATFAKIVGNIPVASVTRDHVEKYRDELPTVVDASDATRECHHSYVSTLFNVAVDQRWIDSNPMRGFKPLKTGAKPKGKRAGAYSRKQLRAVLAKIGTSTTFKAHQKDVAWIVKLAVYHGCRVSELAQLRKEDIRTHDGIAYFSVIDDAGSTKNEGSNRDVPLHPKCAAFVKFAKSKKGDAIFKLPKNGEEAGAYVSAHFGEFLSDECGITDRRFHDFRRTFITRWSRLGFPEYVCKSITGHAHGEDVFDAYKDDADLETKAEWLVKFDPLGD